MTPAKRDLYRSIALAVEQAERMGEDEVAIILEMALDSIRLAPWMPTPAAEPAKRQVAK